MDQSHDDEGLEPQPIAWWRAEHAGYAGHAGEPAAPPGSPRPDDSTQPFQPLSPAGGTWAPGPQEAARPAPPPSPWVPRPGGATHAAGAPWAAPAGGGPWATTRPTEPTSWSPTPPGGPPPPPWAGYGGTTPIGGAPAGPDPGRGRRGLLRVAAAVAVLAATTAAGIGVGHDLWRSTSAASPLSPSSSTAPPSTGGGTSGPTGSGNTGSGNTGSGNPFGNGGEFPGFFPGGTGGNSGSGGSSSSASGAPANVSAIAAKVDPALVDVVTTLGYQGGQAAGTGIVLTSDGEVLTNNHVIDGATNIQVTDIGNGHTYSATVVGYSRTDDVAVLQLQGASGLATAPLGDSSKVAVGDGVVALGNAGGVGGTPSSAGGSVTGLDQTITASDENGSNSETLTGLIQINANIQPGDSGGSLVDSAGRVIGMDTAASSGFVSSSKQGYAIPIDAALTIAHQIEASQASATVHIGRTGFLGVSVSSPTSGASGAQIQSTVPGLPAASAGLAAGDVITAVDGQAVSSPEGLTTQLLQRQPGDAIQITYTDTAGQQHTVSVTLANGPAQ